MTRILTTLFTSGWLLVCGFFAPTLLAAQGEAGVSTESIRKSTQQILDQDQFKHLKDHNNPFDLDGLLNRLETSNKESSPKKTSTRASSSPGWFDWLPSFDFSSLGSAFGMLIEFGFWGILIVIGLVLIYFLGKAVMAYERRKQELTDELIEPTDQQIVAAPGETAVNQYLARARELAANREYAKAIMQLVQGAMSDIERRNQIKFRRGLTSYDYLRAVRGEPPRHQALQQLLRVYEPIGFGRRVATEDHFETSLNQFEAEFLAANPSPNS
ncbi:hypothetical protein Pla110_46120 [Polystyrenella longa]|uniref:Protein-glutamine gamma-glutamyltransferase-like C-terminal domain-containing protein n=1 Tax=Polystyrenella longa TaxID=2528007 RepID=A0A518CUD4_9PLAN|nr:DUF4129 domain-containing protein [Polystyrenella longa]QDU82849.1 hypothetical protein Pla110_46120 [Polystyrenella longa]